MANSLYKQKEKLVKDLDTNITKLDEALSSLKESLDKMQDGDGKFPYWNGNNACVTLKNAFSQYRVNIDLLPKIKECQASIKK